MPFTVIRLLELRVGEKRSIKRAWFFLGQFGDGVAVKFQVLIEVGNGVLGSSGRQEHKLCPRVSFCELLDVALVITLKLR